MSNDCEWTLYFITMNSALLFCSVLSFYDITIANNIGFPTKGNWRSTHQNVFLGSGSTSNHPSHNQTCFPKSWNVLMEQDIINAPTNKCSPVEILMCYCLTSESSSSDVDSGSATFGKCFYGCFGNRTHYQDERSMCAPFNRKGILCGQCKDEYGPAVYSFSLKCVECGNSTHWTPVPRYILVAYGPLTVFLGVIVVFTVSVNSAPLRGWILVCQLLSTNTFMRVLTQSADSDLYPYIATPLLYIVGSTNGIWNLDFFRSVYTPFCLHSSLTTLQVMSLDYIIAAYPLVLILVMYLLVDLYSHNYRPVVIALKPFHYCSTRFRHQLNITTSLVDAFGTSSVYHTSSS